MSIDLEAILAIADNHEARMKIIRECFDKGVPIPEEYWERQTPFGDPSIVKAFESLRPLVTRIRELETQIKDLKAQQDWLVEKIIKSGQEDYRG